MTDPRDAGTPLSPLLTMTQGHLNMAVIASQDGEAVELRNVLTELETQRATLAAHEQERVKAIDTAIDAEGNRIIEDLIAIRHLYLQADDSDGCDSADPVDALRYMIDCAASRRAESAEAALKAMTDERDRLRDALRQVNDECAMAASIDMTVSVRQLRSWLDVTHAALTPEAATEEPTRPVEPQPVVNLMDALKRALPAPKEPTR